MSEKAIQDFYRGDHAVCYGCGRNNEYGLHIRTVWDGKNGTVKFRPKNYHTAFPGAVYGGLVASLIDCSCTGTATAAAYDAEKRSPDTDPAITFVTGNLNVSFLKPSPIDRELVIKTEIKEMKKKKATVTCSLFAGDTECAKGEVIAIRVGAGV